MEVLKVKLLYAEREREREMGQLDHRSSGPSEEGQEKDGRMSAT